ncbi:MAG TPA: hypothetical protein VFU04_02685 [Solirubrobacterales bacterium]|nr:hypothetical protein [Solirubrobacterales bacterium]
MPGRPRHLYLHCGWPRTGTTTIQALFTRHRAALAEAGIAYPLDWQMTGRDEAMGVVNQNGLARLLEPADGTQIADELRRTGEAHRGEAVLMSSEELITWRASRGSRRPLKGLLASLQELAPLTCVATIRRVDDFLSSFYLHHMLGERPLLGPQHYFQQMRAYMDRLMTAMGELEADSEECVHIRYKQSGAHQEDILRVVDIPAGLREQMVAELRRKPRLNARLSKKTVAVLLHREAIAARADMPIPSEALRRMHWAGELNFGDDGPCELLGPDLRRSLHDEALEAARRAGFHAYVEFFGNDEISAPEASAPEPELLLDEDVDYLVDRLAEAQR